MFDDDHGHQPYTYTFMGFRWASISQTPVVSQRPPRGPVGGPGTPDAVENLRLVTPALAPLPSCRPFQNRKAKSSRNGLRIGLPV